MDFIRRHEGHHEVEEGRYWALGYSFVDLNDKQKHQRREYLDWYGFVAQWSVLVIFALFQISFFVAWLVKSGLRYDPPKSPSFNKRMNGKSGILRNVQKFCQKWVWWLQKDVVSNWNWGTRGEWIGASLWSVWLLYLCVARTGNDYLHLTKRFGQIGASQLPVHYLLAMRAPYSPIQCLTRLSHEQLKSSHQILGRIIIFLFTMHAICYLNFFIVSNLLAKRIKEKDVIFGLISITLFAILSTTALSFIRRWNYRIFYTTHIIIATFIVVPLYLHVSHIHIFIYEILLIEVLHFVFRALRFKMYTGTIKLVPGTDLVQVRIPLPGSSSALNWKPGQHVYLSRPSKGSSPSLYDQWLMVNKTNPFTVASLPDKDKELMLIARTLKGNTRYLADLARGLAQGGSGVQMLPTASGDIPILPIALEGPYGASKHLPDLSDYDRVLLVAGGVGATFVLPIYRGIAELHDPAPGGTQVRFIWAVRKLADTYWAFPATASSDEDEAENTSDTEEANGNGFFHGPSRVEVYVTRVSNLSAQADAEDDEDGEGIELQEHEQLLNMEEQMEKPRKGMMVKSGRPKIGEIVDEVFSKGIRTAVVCCGPKKLTQDLRQNVERWVAKGHDVFWYDETFGW